MKLFVITSLLLSSTVAFAQSPSVIDTAASETPSPWEKSWVFSLTGNDADYKNWSRGGVNSTAYVASTLFEAKYSGTVISNMTRVNFKFGQVNQEGVGIEKTEDLLLITNKTDYFLNHSAWSAFIEVSFRTQFTEGFDKGSGELLSAFLSPGYLTESLGLSYQPNEYFSAQLGSGLKQTFVEKDGLDQFYGLGEDEDVRSEGGLTLGMQFKKELFPNFTYATELSTFSNLLISLKSTDVIMTNVFTGKINNFMTSSFEWSFIYDDDFSTELQTKRIISLGIEIQLF
ncbi:MAG: DUF3078 domain-containing protein [Balneolaceae bacterium]